MTDSTEKDAAAKLLAEAEANDAQAAEERALAAALLADGIAPPVAVDPPAPDPVKPPPGPAAPPPGTVSPPDPKSPPQDPPAAPPSAPGPGPATPAAPPAVDPPAPGPAPAAPPVAITPSSKVPTLPLDPETYGDFVAMHPGFKPAHVAEAVLAALSTTEPAGTPGEMVYAEGGTGYRPELGERAYGSQLWATTMDPRARVHMLAEADLAKESFPIHDTINGLTTPPKPWLWSMSGYAHQYDSADVVRTPDPLAVDGIVLDLAHFPQFMFDATILMAIEGNATKFAEYLNEMKWIVSKFFFDRVLQTPQYCQGTKGIFNSLTGQQREQAWGLRGVDDLLFVLEHFVPDDEWMVWLTQCLAENVKFRDGVFRTGTYETQGDLNHAGPWQPGVFIPYGDYATGKFVNKFGITRGADGYSTTAPVIALWQQGFESAVVTRSHNRDHPSLSDDVKATHAALVDWLGNLWRMTLGAPNNPATYDYRRASAYTFQTGTFVDPTFDPARPGAKGVNFWQTPAEFFAQFAALPALGPDDHLLRKHDDPDNTPLTLPGDFLDNCIPAIYGAVDAGVDLAEGLGYLESTSQWQGGGDLAFAWLSKGKKYPVDDGGATVTPPPVVTPPVQPAAPALVPFDPKSGTLIASEVSPPGMTKYTPIVDGVGYWGAGALFFAIPLKAGVVVALDYTVLGDPAPGIAKALYLPGTVAATPPASGPVAGPTPTEPDPDPPVVEPTSGAVADFGSAGYTTEETGDDHIPLPGPVVDPSTWVPTPGQAIPMPMKGTLRDAAPSWFKDIANFALDIWTGGGWLKDLEAAWTMAGGHATVEADFAALLFPKCLAWQVRNRPNQQITSADSIAGKYQGPDDIGSFDEPEAMHPYTGTVVRDGDLDVGPEAVVYATRFNPVGVTNDIFMMNPKMLTGGGWALYAKSRGIPIGNYATAAVSRKRKGFFIGDSRDGRMFFCPFNPSIPWFEVGSVIPEWGNGRLIVDESRDNGLLIGVNGSVDPYFDPTGANPNHATQLNVALSVRDLMNDALDAPVTTLAVDVSKDPLLFFGPDGVTPNFEPDRYGIDYAPGSGFIGVKRTSKGGRYIRIRWNDPKNWRAGATPETLDVGADVGTPINDVYGSLWLRQFFLKQGDARFYAIHPTTADDAPWCLGLEVIEQ